MAGVDRKPESCYGGSGVSVLGVVVSIRPVRKDFAFASEAISSSACARLSDRTAVHTWVEGGVAFDE